MIKQSKPQTSLDIIDTRLKFSKGFNIWSEREVPLKVVETVNESSQGYKIMLITTNKYDKISDIEVSSMKTFSTEPTSVVPQQCPPDQSNSRIYHQIQNPYSKSNSYPLFHLHKPLRIIKHDRSS